MLEGKQVLLGSSPAICAVRVEIENAARTSAKILIVGETGVGKEVVARMIHDRSARATRRFVAVNCSGVPETLLESELFGHTRGSFTGAYRDKPGVIRLADGGSLFLDELGEMSLRMQAVLLRFAETGEVQPIGATALCGKSDARLITATNRDLRQQIAAGEFREDLYYRLNVIRIRVPPLRDRAQDVPVLLRHFFQLASAQHRVPVPEITPAAMEALATYRWPGNIRELKNVVERLAIRRADWPLAPEDLPIETHDTRSTVRQAGQVDLHGTAANATTTPVHSQGTSRAAAVWQQIQNGESFWTAAHRPFKGHDLTRDDLRTLIHRGLEETRGSYRQLVPLFRMQPSDYKRFLGFLDQYGCKLPFHPHRMRAGARTTDDCAVA